MNGPQIVCTGCGEASGVKLTRLGCHLCQSCKKSLGSSFVPDGSKQEMDKAATQRTMVQLNPDARYLVQGYHTGDFLGAVATAGLSGAEFVVERSFSKVTLYVGDRVWVPYANYVEIQIDRGEDAP